jgi:hypothetical protein
MCAREIEQRIPVRCTYAGCDALEFVPDQCAGLPLAFAVAGRAVEESVT